MNDRAKIKSLSFNSWWVYKIEKKTDSLTAMADYRYSKIPFTALHKRKFNWQHLTYTFDGKIHVDWKSSKG